jgi:hypothetical protein
MQYLALAPAAGAVMPGSGPVAGIGWTAAVIARAATIRCAMSFLPLMATLAGAD